MAKRVYHWRHGWIPLDHVALAKKYPGASEATLAKQARKHGIDGTPVKSGLNPVGGSHLPRSKRITAGYNPDKAMFSVVDPQGRMVDAPNGGNAYEAVAAAVPEDFASRISSEGWAISAVAPDGTLRLRKSYGKSDHTMIVKPDGSDFDVNLGKAPAWADTGRNARQAQRDTAKTTPNPANSGVESYEGPWLTSVFGRNRFRETSEGMEVKADDRTVIIKGTSVTQAQAARALVSKDIRNLHWMGIQDPDDPWTATIQLDSDGVPVPRGRARRYPLTGDSGKA